MSGFRKTVERLALKEALANGCFRLGEIECKLKSGRVFRYDLTDYPFRVDASEAEIDDLACQIIKDKYRYCEWDREHPRSNTELEIFNVIKAWMLAEVAKGRQLRAETDQVRFATPPAKPDPAN